ncbi:hypothetical protein ACQPXH_26675 [Nocardia sp. CA-135953]|uniref:hypothetical protein n=1 Tax=Nocardia sp. CA-135953 TaxID=3239978 RepID=UPI003D969F40
MTRRDAQFHYCQITVDAAGTAFTHDIQPTHHDAAPGEQTDTEAELTATDGDKQNWDAAYEFMARKVAEDRALGLDVEQPTAAVAFYTDAAGGATAHQRSDVTSTSDVPAPMSDRFEEVAQPRNENPWESRREIRRRPVGYRSRLEPGVLRPRRDYRYEDETLRSRDVPDPADRSGAVEKPYFASEGERERWRGYLAEADRVVAEWQQAHRSIKASDEVRGRGNSEQAEKLAQDAADRLQQAIADMDALIDRAGLSSPENLEALKMSAGAETLNEETGWIAQVRGREEDINTGFGLVCRVLVDDGEFSVDEIRGLAMPKSKPAPLPTWPVSKHGPAAAPGRYQVWGYQWYRVVDRKLQPCDRPPGLPNDIPSGDYVLEDNVLRPDDGRNPPPGRPRSAESRATPEPGKPRSEPAADTPKPTSPSRPKLTVVDRPASSDPTAKGMVRGTGPTGEPVWFRRNEAESVPVLGKNLQPSCLVFPTKEAAEGRLSDRDQFQHWASGTNNSNTQFHTALPQPAGASEPYAFISPRETPWAAAARNTGQSPIWVQAHGSEHTVDVKVGDSVVKVDGATFGRMLLANPQFQAMVAANPAMPVVLLSCKSNAPGATVAKDVAKTLHKESKLRADVYGATGRPVAAPYPNEKVSELGVEEAIDPATGRVMDPWVRHRRPSAW